MSAGSARRAKQSTLWLALVGIGSGMFNSPNTAAMMGTVPAWRRGIAAGVSLLRPAVVGRSTLGATV